MRRGLAYASQQEPVRERGITTAREIQMRLGGGESVTGAFPEKPKGRTERQREAAEFRAQGSEKSQEIRARADRDVTVLIADATQGGEQARGDGDADRARIFAQAYGKDPEFYAFYRSMQAYETALHPNNTRIVFAAGLSVLPLFRWHVGRAALEIANKWQHLGSSRLKGGSDAGVHSQRLRLISVFSRS